MKRQLSKIITLALILGISTILVSASSLSTSFVTTFEVDFDFQIGNSKYSKGTYRLSRHNPTVFVLENKTESETKVLLGMPLGGFAANDNESKMIFNRYGDRYFLREVVSPLVNVKIGLSRDEKNVRRNAQETLAKVKVENKK